MHPDLRTWLPPSPTPAALDDLASLGVLAGRLSAGLLHLADGFGGQTEDDALFRWLSGSSSPDDQQRLAAVSPGSRLLLVQCGSPTVPSWISARPGERLLLARLPDSALAVLVPGAPGPVGSDRALRRARDLGTEVTRYDGEAGCAISGPLTDHVDIHRALQDVRDALAVAATRLVEAQDCWREIGALRLIRAAQGLVPTPHPVQRLKAYDDKHGSDLARTLLLWLDESGDVPTVARRLHLHANSVRYRVRRAHEVAGISMHDATARLLVHVLLRGSGGDSLAQKQVHAHDAR